MIKIIIIEDLPIILEGLKVLINQIKDFEVLADFTNGKEYIDNINKYKADIILTDIAMPIMDGISTTKHALSIHPDEKIIALSMYNDHKYYYEMITAGAKGFVLKQSSVEELELAIREVHSGNNYFSKDLLHNVIIKMQSIEYELIREKKHNVNLNEREINILKFICLGYTNQQLADALFVSIKTIESNKAKLMQKTNTLNNAGLIIWAIKNKITEI